MKPLVSNVISKYLLSFGLVKVPPWPESNGTFQEEGIDIPCAGPGGITVKEIVMTAKVAQAEVLRLNALNADKECVYYWQTTHLFPNGESHG